MNTYLVHPTNEQEQLLKAFLKGNQISFLNGGEKSPGCVLDEISEGLGNGKTSDSTTSEEFRRTMFYSG
jgi:hypothetical protein